MTLTKQSAIPNFKMIWFVALPIMLSMLAQNIVSTTDTAFLGHVGEVELGASAIGGIYYFVLFMIGFGFATGMQILIARRHGEKNLSAIGPIMENGLLFLWLTAAFLIGISLIFTPIVMPHILKSENLLQPTINFLNIRIFALFFGMVNVSFRAFHVGTANTRPLTYGAIIMAVTNIVLDYALIFGNLGFPKMGIEGAALASVIAEAVEAIYLIAYNSRAHIRKVYKLFYFKSFDIKVLKHTLEVSIFVMLQYFISLSTWFTFFIFIEKTGEQNLASSNIVRNVYGFITIPIWAYAAATSSFVSNAIGAGRVADVPSIIRKMVKISVITAFIIVIPVSILHKPILGIFTNNTELIKLSITSVFVILFTNIIFACSCVPFNGLSGTGRTKVAMFIEIITLMFYIAGLYIIVQLFPHQVAYAWFSEFIYWGFLLVFTLLYFRYGKWRETRI